MAHATAMALRLLLFVAAAPALAACSFLEAAGEVTLGAKEGVPKVSTDLVWPSAAALLGDDLVEVTGGAKAPAGLPAHLGAATLAHVQGLMTIDGECQREVLVPTVESKIKETKLRDLRFRLTNCHDPALRCVAECAGFRGMKIEARLQYQLLDEATAKRIRATLSDQTSAAAIVQVRLQFSRLNYFEPAPGDPKGKISITKLFANSELGLASEGGGDDTVVVTQRYLGKISPTTPQRFEIDPKAPFTRATKEAVLAAKPKWLEIFQRIDVAQANLYALTLGGGGVELEFQPEFVISALEVAKSAL